MTDIPNHLVDLKSQIRERSKRERQLIEDPDIMDVITANIANGGSLITLCEIWNVTYGRIAAWVNKDKERRALMSEAYVARSEWAKEGVLRELHCLAHFDIRRTLNDDGTVKPLKDWPVEVARALEMFEVQEQITDGEKTGQLKKFKFNPKIRALELLGKAEALFVERMEVKQTFTLADLTNQSWKDVTPTEPVDE